MFSNTRKKRLRSRVLFAAIGVAVLSFGIWLNWYDGQREQVAEDVNQSVKVETSGESASEEEKSSEQMEDADENETGTESTSQTYLIEEVDGVVKVFLCDEEGGRELYQITSIPFDLLSESDQELFEEGVTVETEDELGEFLQNFDS